MLETNYQTPTQLPLNLTKPTFHRHHKLNDNDNAAVTDPILTNILR